MHRRGFLRGGAASLAAIAPWPMEFKRKKHRGAAHGITHFGTPRPFSFGWLKKLARSMSLTVYNEPMPQPAQPEGLDVEGVLRGLPAPRRQRGRM